MAARFYIDTDDDGDLTIIEPGDPDFNDGIANASIKRDGLHCLWTVDYSEFYPEFICDLRPGLAESIHQMLTTLNSTDACPECRELEEFFWNNAIPPQHDTPLIIAAIADGKLVNWDITYMILP